MPDPSTPRALTRRAFLKSGAAAAAAWSLPRFAIGQPKAEREKLRIGIVAVGGRGKTYVHGCGREKIVALCDVDWNRCGALLKSVPGARLFKDYREMLEKAGSEIDAVTVATPDHMHYPVALSAMRHGKHVLVEKPLAHSLAETRTLQQQAKQLGVVTQMGNQGHAFEGIRLIREWYEAGLLGEVREIHAWTERPYAVHFRKPESVPPPEAPVPDGMPWDVWLGTAHSRPFSEAYHPMRWRGWWDFGAGALGDIGCHTIDAPFWALGLGAPERIEVKVDPPWKEHTAFGATVVFHFPARDARPPVKLTWFEGDHKPPRPPMLEEGRQMPDGGLLMFGTKNTLFCPGMRPRSPRLIPEERMQAVRGSLPAKTYPRVRNHIEEWLSACKGGEAAPGAAFEYSAPLTEVILLGALAIRTGQSFSWNAESRQITDARDLNRYLNPPLREGWII